MQAALQVLAKFRRLAESHQVEVIEAVATSAVREAENGGEFLKAIVAQTGIRARIISGTEEARLIHLAAGYGIGLIDKVGVTVDIGGGSVEITHGTGPTLATGRSFKLGVIRLTERFVKSDPLSQRDERRMVRHILSELKSYLKTHQGSRLRSRGRHLRIDPERRHHRRSRGRRRRADGHPQSTRVRETDSPRAQGAVRREHCRSAC